MGKHIEIVTVTYCRGKQGERRPWDFNDWQINRPDPDDWPEDLGGFDYQDKPIAPAHIMEDRFGGVRIDLPTDWFGMRFGFVGQGFENEVSLLSLDCDAAGPNEVFGKWAEKLKAMGDKLLDAEIARREMDFVYWQKNKTPREVTFLTAWEYTVDDYENECWSEHRLLGLILIDLSNIAALVVAPKMEKPEKTNDKSSE